MPNTQRNSQHIFSDNYQQPMVTLDDLLADYDDGQGITIPKYFRIPIYQRGYAWGIRQCYELWEDIKRIKENKVKSHFIGTLSLNRNSSDMDDYIKDGLIYDVVDGQQRFTTLMIILRLLLNKLSVNAVKYIGNSKHTRKFQYSISNTKARSYLEGRLYSLNANFPHNDDAYSVNIENAIQFYNEDKSYDRRFNLFVHKPNFPEKYHSCNISGMSDRDAQDYLDVVLNKLVFCVNFVGKNCNKSITFDENTVFESMNNRGKEPTRLEVLKNRLMYLTQNRNTLNDIHDTWGKIYASLGSKSYAVLNDDEFLKCHWYMYHGGIVKQNKDEHIWQIFDDVFSLDKVNTPDIQQQTEDYIDSINSCIYIWQYLNIPDLNAKNVPNNLTSGDTATLIGKLSRLVQENTYPYLKSFILAALCVDLPQKDLDRLLDVIEKYVFIIGYLKHDKNAYSSSWATEAAKLYDLNRKSDLSGLHKKVDEIIAEKETEIKNNLSAALDEFYKVKDGSAGYYEWSGRWYFLFEYDLFIQANNGRIQIGAGALAWYDWNTIEHILPESPYKNEYWKKAFGAYINNSDAMKVFMHSPGNFLPLDGKNNSSLGNKDYYTKCNGNGTQNGFWYKNGCASARYVVQTYGDRYWTPTQIYARIDSMAEFLFDTWIAPYAGGKITAQDIADNLKVANLNPPVPSQIDSVTQQELDREIANIQQRQAQPSGGQGKRRQRSQQGNLPWFAVLLQPLENTFKAQGFKFVCNESYLRIYKPNWHKAKKSIHYEVWGKQFALMCENSTDDNTIRKLAADNDIKSILSDYYSDYRGQFADNRMNISKLTDAERLQKITDIINATSAKIDACI